MRVHDLIGTGWSHVHFDMNTVTSVASLFGAFTSQSYDCGAAGCVSGFLPLVDKRISVTAATGLFSVRGVGDIGGYLDIAMHCEGLGLTYREAEYLCNPSSYLDYADGTGRWTRARVRKRIRGLVRKYHPDLAKSGRPMRYRRDDG